jgi:transposase
MARLSETADRTAQLSQLAQLHLNAAGLDIGASEIWACVPGDRAAEPVRRFETFTVDLHALADWLIACGITTVAMESTGIYWIPIYEILESCGLEVCLVNAHATKNVSGRKSDLLDCQWIQQLHTYGLLQPSFRPAVEICTLRSYVRQRETLLRQRASHIQHMQKALHLMNLKLTSVISDITGTTGMQILRAILAGERDPQQLAQLRDHRCKRSTDEIAKALTGHYQPEHLFALRQAVEAYDFYTRQLTDCDAALERHYALLEAQGDPVAPPLAPRPLSRRANQPHFDLRRALYALTAVDLTQVEGIDTLVAQDILAEIGLDMSKWPSDKHFASWLGLCPNHKSSAGRIQSRRSKPTNNRANKALRLAAQSVSRSQSAIGAFYRRIRAKHGAPVAVTATAHKLARIVYHMLKARQPYQALSPERDAQRHRERVVRTLQRQAQRLGLQLVPQTTAAVS